MFEASKAAARRKMDWRYANRWIVGRVIDVGSGNDTIKVADYPLITEVVPYDKSLGHKDGQFLPEIGDGLFDCVVSSHSLEHMVDVRVTLVNWLRVLKPGGFVVCTIPEELLYESGRWPSTFNGDHKQSFSLRSIPIIPRSTNLTYLLWKMQVDVEHLSLLTEGWDKSKFGQDQTLGPAECALEFVVRKPLARGSFPF